MHFPLDPVAFLVSWPRMRQSTPPSPVRRIAAALLVAGLLVPAPGWAADEETPAEETAAETTAEEGTTAEEAEGEEAPAPAEKHWYTPVVHNTDIGIDLVLIRPMAAITLVAGALLYVPAVIMTAPNGKESMGDAYERFVREPGEYFYSRPLGEF